MLKINSIFLFMTSIIWGISFVSQDIANDYLEVYTYNTIRLGLGFLSLIPLVFIFKRQKQIGSFNFKTTLIGGCVCGLFLAIACNLQQYGLKYSTVGKAGFITALYIVLVPIIGIFIGRRVSPSIWLAVLTAIAGFYFISIPSGSSFSIEMGDVILLICALAYALHVTVTDHFCQICNSFELACLQFLFAGIISAIPALALEAQAFEISKLQECIYAVLFSGICATGIAYTFQILGQKGNNPTIAAMVLSLESVFALISGYLYLNEKIDLRMGIGCLLIALAIVLAQLNKDLLKTCFKKLSNSTRKHKTN